MNDLMPQIAEMYTEWCRLKGYNAPKTPIESMVDNATGAEAARMREFAEWFRLEILSRLPE